MYEKLEISLREQIFFLTKTWFSKILISLVGVKMKFRIRKEKYKADSAIALPKKSILGPNVFTNTTRQRESKPKFKSNDLRHKMKLKLSHFLGLITKDWDKINLLLKN